MFNRKVKRSRPPQSKRPSLRPESLEDRRMMTTYVVTSPAASGPGTLEAAVIAADSNTSNDKIIFSSAMQDQTINLTGGTLIMSEGTGDLFIDGANRNVTVDAANVSDHLVVFEVPGQNRTSLRIDGLTFKNGNLFGGLGGASSIDAADAELELNNVRFLDNSNGPAVLSSPTGQTPDPQITIRHSAFRNNDGGGLQVGFNNGGFIIPPAASTSSGNIEISASEFSGNINDYGGAISVAYAPKQGFHPVLLDINNTTISGNTATDDGGGIFISSPDLTANIDNSTIVYNAAADQGGGVWGGGSAGVINNSIVYHNTASGVANDVANSFSGSNNLIDVSLSGSLLGGAASPGIAPLADNGGFTWTHALTTGSPAIDAGDNAYAPSPLFSNPNPSDQRGPMYLRIIGGTVDIGAYECSPATVRGRVLGHAKGSTANHGQNGWTVTLTDGTSTLTTTTQNIDLNGDGVTQTATESGWYEVHLPNAGTWNVSETIPANWSVSYPYSNNYNVVVNKAGMFGNSQPIDSLDFVNEYKYKFLPIVLSSATVSLNQLQLGTTGQVINFEGLHGKFVGDVFTDSLGVTFENVKTGVEFEGGSTVEQLDAYDGRRDGSEVLVSFPNHENPVTVIFDEPVSSFGAFIGTGAEGDVETLTVEAFDVEGNRLFAEQTHVSLNENPENREGTFSITLDEPIISRFSIRNDNETNYGNALIMDDLFWDRPEATVIPNGTAPLSSDDVNGDGVVDVNDLDVLCEAEPDEVAGFMKRNDIRAGDANGDGNVGFEDFLMLSANFGKENGGWSGGDFNCDGVTGFDDFLALSSLFGQAGSGRMQTPLSGDAVDFVFQS